MEECADIEDRVIEEGEQLIACPGSGSIDLNKTEVCNVIARKKGYEKAIASGFCKNAGEFSILLSSCAHEWCRVHEAVEPHAAISFRAPRD